MQVGLTLVSVVAKLAYSYDLGAWTFLEGMMSARSHPNMLFWNITRFNPFYCMLEVRAWPAGQSVTEPSTSCWDLPGGSCRLYC